VSSRIPNQVPMVGRISQRTNEAGSIGDGSPRELAECLRAGNRDHHAPCLGQGHEAADASKPGQ
jgi:hypothetical protein